MSAICQRAGCGKTSWNGQQGEYCGRGCRHLAVGSSPQAPPQPAAGNGAICVRKGCGKPSWNGQVGQFCSKGCRTSGPPCAKPGCGKPTWNGEAGEFCSQSCRAGAGASPKVLPGTQVSQDKFADLQAQFQSKWRAPGAPPKIASIWHVHDDQLMQKHLAYCAQIGNVPVKGPGKNPGNQQRRFHASALQCKFNGTPCSTAGCNVCSIIKTGFQVSRAGTTAGSRYGSGIYSSATPSKAYGYGNQRAMFVVGVAVGVADVSTDSSALPASCHSRVVKNADDELIVFQNEAIVPKYLIVFA